MNIETVAQKTGVFIATESLMCNAPDMVRAATRERVQEKTRRLDYHVNASTRTLRTQRSRDIGARSVNC